MGILDSAYIYCKKEFDFINECYTQNPNDLDLKQNVFSSYLDMGDLEQQLGYDKEAEEYYNNALKIAKALEATDRENFQYKNDISLCLERLASINNSKGKNLSADKYDEKKMHR